MLSAIGRFVLRPSAIAGFLRDRDQALSEVTNTLENCLVEPSEKVIVRDDGRRLSIAETAHRIHLQSDLPLSKIESHVAGWLEIHYEPKKIFPFRRHKIVAKKRFIVAYFQYAADRRVHDKKPCYDAAA